MCIGVSFNMFGNQRAKLHIGQYIPFQIRPSGNFNQHGTILCQLEHSPLRDIKHILSSGNRHFSVIGYLLNLLYQFPEPAFLEYFYSTFVKFHLDLAACKGRTEYHVLCSAGNINKTTGAGRNSPPFWLHSHSPARPFPCAHECIINSCPCIIFKLPVMGYQRLGTARNAKVNPPAGTPPYMPDSTVSITSS